MSRGNRRSRPSGYSDQSDFSEIIRELNELADKVNRPRDSFWARLDTLCQLTPEGTNRGDRIAQLREGFPSWLNHVPFEEQLIEKYDSALMAGIYFKSWSKRRHVMLQIASLGAKLLWGDPKYANTTWAQMFETCIDELRNGYDYDGLDSFGRNFVEKELKEMLKRYTDKDNKCREIVRSFFRDHAESYEDVLERLAYRVNNEMKRDRKQDRTDEKKNAAPAAAETALEKAPEQLTEEKAPVAAAHSDEFLQIMERLNYMERSLARISRNVDEFDDDACGLCKFMERTASYVHNRPLSRLYDLYENMPEQVSASELKMILGTFFHSLQTLDIKPINEQRLEKDFPEEYSEEIAGRGGKAYRFLLCGWSYKDSMVIAPQFEEEKQ